MLLLSLIVVLPEIFCLLEILQTNPLTTSMHTNNNIETTAIRFYLVVFIGTLVIGLSIIFESEIGVGSITELFLSSSIYMYL